MYISYTSNLTEVFFMEPRNKNAELVFIIDRSGSMAGMESDTIGGFNSMLEQQKKTEGNKFVTTYLFNHRSWILHDRMAINDVRPLTEEDYRAGGSTALIGCIGEAIKHIEDVHRYIRPEDVPIKTIFAITTDGLENASRHFSSDEVKAMIEKKKKENDWEFLFIGANIDAVETAKRYGIGEDRALNYRPNHRGTMSTYDAMSCFVEETIMYSDIGGGEPMKFRDKIDNRDDEMPF